MVNPPVPGEPSYDLYKSERETIYNDLKAKAKMLVEALNGVDGFSCQVAEGAMYAFPSIQLGPGVIKAAEAAGQAPDLFYCLALLEETGICCVPGSGFGQVRRPVCFLASGGTWIRSHLRCCGKVRRQGWIHDLRQHWKSGWSKTFGLELCYQ